jgi:hypothetical protein
MSSSFSKSLSSSMSSFICTEIIFLPNMPTPFYNCRLSYVSPYFSTALFLQKAGTRNHTCIMTRYLCQENGD